MSVFGLLKRGVSIRTKNVNFLPPVGEIDDTEQEEFQPAKKCCDLHVPKQQAQQ